MSRTLSVDKGATWRSFSASCPPPPDEGSTPPGGESLHVLYSPFSSFSSVHKPSTNPAAAQRSQTRVTSTALT